MALTYREALQRLGRRVVVQIDKRRGTEIRRAPGEAGEAGDIQVRYRGTPVVTFHSDGTYTLRTGGMATRTVRNRIAEYSPVSLAYRGGAYFIEDVNTGRLSPFLEGMRVNQTGTILGVGDGPMGASLPAVESAGAHGALPPHVLDEAKLRAFVARLVDERLRDAGAMTPLPQGTEGTPVRAVKLRARARELPTGEPMITLSMLERLLLDAGIRPEKVRKQLRDTQAALLRGRGGRTDSADDTNVGRFAEAAGREPETTTVHVPGVDCEKCGLNIVAHYDNANRYRGCDYAARHREDVTLI